MNSQGGAKKSENEEKNYVSDGGSRFVSKIQEQTISVKAIDTLRLIVCNFI
ncbi:MAG: hypothetical protein KAU07_00440 [Candidatus Andersenbacteria bacterium]|nr:hypothetical protein [Candidatus Andersenbacteria bacterium]